MQHRKNYQISLFVIGCILINCLGKWIAAAGQLPVWMDSFGTVCSAYALGPFCGGVVGAATNVIYGFYYKTSYVYALTNIAVGILTGYYASKGYLKDLFKTMSLSFLITLLSVGVSVPLNYVFYSGRTGNIWGDGVIDLLGQMGVEITAQIADCLYTGIATDTGCFRFANTTARSHITAAWLMEAGARASELNARLFESKKPQRVEAERLALNNLEYYFDGRCALIYLTREDILSSGVAPSDLEDLTSLPRAIEGVEVGLTLRQQPGGSYKISVRTTDEVDACAIAKRLGGGGHVRAAGCELMGNLDNAKAAVLAEVKKELARCEQKE